MGAEELKKRRKSHEKHLDKKRVELSTPDLFTETPSNQPRCVLASIPFGASLNEGECLVIEALDGMLLGRRDHSVVATCESPPADIFDAIRNGAGVAAGIVQRINKLSKTAEVRIR